MKLKEIVKKYGDYEITDLEKIKGSLEKPKPRTVWDLNTGDNFYLVGVGVSEMAWANNYEIFLEWREGGDVFLTAEEAEKELARRKIEALLKKYANGYEFEFYKDNFYLFVDYDVRDVYISYEVYEKYGGEVYFSSREDAEKAVQEIGKDRLLRDYFQIEEEQEDGK